jgi:cytochrome c-type biogenesis protein CcmE
MTMQAPARRKGMTRKQKRIAVIAGLAVVLALATTLVLTALRDQIVFFYTPADITTKEVAVGKPIRLGGMVQDKSWVRTGQDNIFIIEDGADQISAKFVGILPDLFRDGQGVVAEGSMQPDGSFLATNVLAKHDENYVPREVVEALKEKGEWYPEATE